MRRLGLDPASILNTIAGSRPSLRHWVNKHLDVGPDTPFGGAKQSGIGVEMGQEGLEEFTQATIINMAK